MIYFLHGPNTYALAHEARRLKQEFTAQHGDHGFEQVNAEDVQPASLGELLLGVSLFSQQRMIVLRGAAEHKQLWEALEPWIDKVPDEVQFILVESAPDKRTRTFKALTKTARVFEAPLLNETEAATWVAQQARQRQGKDVLSRALAALLVSRIGTDQSALGSELDKLLLYENIDQRLITELTEAVPSSTAFELLDAVLARRTAKAQDITRQLRFSEDPYRLFGLFASQVGVLAAVVAAGPKLPPAAVAKDIGAHPFVVSKLAKISARTSWAEVTRVIDAVATLDDKLKSSAADPWELLEATLIKTAAR